MPETGTITDFVSSVGWDTTQLYKPHDEDPSEDARRVSFDDSPSVVLLQPNPRYSAFRNILTLLLEVEMGVDADVVDDVLIDLRVPDEGSVLEARNEPDGSLLVRLSDSAAVYYVSAGPDFAGLREQLQGAVGQRLLVVTAGDGQILRIRRPSRQRQRRARGEQGSLAAAALTGPAALGRIDRVSMQEAEAIFRDLREIACPLPHGREMCAPFTYPDNGCWARAEAMYQRIRAAHQRQAGKLWIYGNLRTHTENSPTCRVRWYHHVAPVLRLDDGTNHLLVFDPSVFCRVASPVEWQAALGDAKACQLLTDGSVYYQSEPGEPSTDKSEVANDLKFFLACLMARAKGEMSPPPYHCPPCPNG